MTPKVVILGSSGFIGQNLITKIDEAVGVSIRSNCWDRQLSSASVLINLVGKAHDHKGRSNDSEYYYVNVDLVKNIFNVFVNSSVELFIHVSSLAAVEELESTKALNEDDSCNPISPYGKSKREIETWLLSQELPNNKKLIIIRPPMVHGLGDKGNLGLLYKFIAKGIPYPLSNFDNRRSFISIDNFIFFINQIIKNHCKLVSGIYHVSDDEEISTKEVIQIMKYVTNKKIPNLALPKFFVKAVARVGDIVPILLNSTRLKKMTGSLTISNSKIKNALGIKKLPLTAKEGLIKTVETFKSGSN